MSFFNKAMSGDNILQKAELKENAFRVPEGYFDNLSERVSSRVAADCKTGSRKVFLGRLWPIAAAASLAAVAIGFWQNSGRVTPEATAEQEYLLEYLNISDSQFAVYEEADPLGNVTQDEIMDYLTNNDLSGEYIYDLLAEAE